MSERRVLLVTGSRALADTGASEEWARSTLVEAMAFLRDGQDTLVHGGATGPDTWAWEIAQGREHAVEAFYPDGRLRISYPAGSEHDDQHGTWGRLDRTRSPLARNAHMIEVLSLLRERECEVLVAGLVAPWSRTHGTEHTLRLARKAKLPTVQYTAPWRTP